MHGIVLVLQEIRARFPRELVSFDTLLHGPSSRCSVK
jgi:hypothetical protein